MHFHLVLGHFVYTLQTWPRDKSFKYDSEGEISQNRLKNIKRKGKTIYEFTLTMFPSKKRKRKGFLPTFRLGSRGEFAWGASLNVHELTRYPFTLFMTRIPVPGHEQVSAHVKV